MKVLIIEDERPASKKLTRLLREIVRDIEIVDVLTSVEQSTNWFLGNEQPDLVFMDVQLEDGICFDIFESCKVSTPVIFTTAFDEYALKAFKVNSVDYLLKPINQDELKNAIDKFKTFHGQKTDQSGIESVLKQLQPGIKERFLIKIGEHYRSVPVSDIYCFYIKERCNFILVSTGKNYPVDYSLDKTEQLIDPKMFFRINRNFIISYSSIRDIISYSSSRLKVVIANWPENDEILVSRERVARFKEWMDR